MRSPNLCGGPPAQAEARPGSPGVTLTLHRSVTLGKQVGLSGLQFSHQPHADEDSIPRRARAVRGPSSLTWALQGGCRVESEPAEMEPEAGPRRGHCWQTRSGVQAWTGWGARQRRLLPPLAQESEGALGSGLSLLAAGPGDARWTWVGAVEWGCGGRRGCEPEKGVGSTSLAGVPVETRGGRGVALAGAPPSTPPPPT